MSIHSDRTDKHYSNRRLRSTTDRRLKNRIEELDFEDRRVKKERRGFFEDVRRFIFDRRQEVKEVDLDRREIQRRNYVEQRRQLRDRRLVAMTVENDRRKAVRRAEEIQKLREIDPGIDMILGPQEVENDLNRHK
jgi:hypothetical protein